VERGGSKSVQPPAVRAVFRTSLGVQPKRWRKARLK
jgi:hypothetical protein